MRKIFESLGIAALILLAARCAPSARGEIFYASGHPTYISLLRQSEALQAAVGSGSVPGAATKVPRSALIIS